MLTNKFNSIKQILIVCLTHAATVIGIRDENKWKKIRDSVFHNIVGKSFNPIITSSCLYLGIEMEAFIKEKDALIEAHSNLA